MKTLTLLASALLLSACASQVPEQLQLQSTQMSDLRDIDNDGVINARDLCLASPDGAQLNNSGCSAWKNAPSRKLFTFNFDLNSAKIREDQHPTIERVVKEVLASDDATVVLIGDTSPEGSDELNQKLAKDRATAIEGLLLSSGLPAARIEGFVYNDAQVKARMDRRERRTIVLVKRPVAATPVTAWSIYQAEQQQQLAQIQEGQKK